MRCWDNTRLKHVPSQLSILILIRSLPKVRTRIRSLPNVRSGSEVCLMFVSGSEVCLRSATLAAASRCWDNSGLKHEPSQLYILILIGIRSLPYVRFWIRSLPNVCIRCRCRFAVMIITDYSMNQVNKGSRSRSEVGSMFVSGSKVHA